MATKRNRIEYLQTLSPVDGYYDVSLPLAISHVSAIGDWVEFGTSTGNSAQIIYRLLLPNINLHLFDTFTGLPEDWYSYTKGMFNGKPPEWMFQTSNIKIHEGLFENTIPEFIKIQERKLSFINVDCDLYSSTKTIFDNIDELIVPGTVIHFDEFYNFNGWQLYEFKAFIEYVTNYDRDFEYLGRTTRQEVWLKIVR